MRHKFLVLTVKKLLKSMYIYGSYRKIKTGVSLLLDHPVQTDRDDRGDLIISPMLRYSNRADNNSRKSHASCEVMISNNY